MGVNKWHVAREGSLLCTLRTVSLALVSAGVESCSCGLRVLHGGPPAVHLSDTHLEERPASGSTTLRLALNSERQ